MPSPVLPLSCSIPRIGVLLLGLASASAWCADDASWKLSGFGTLGVVHSNRRAADFQAASLKGRGAGYSNRWSPNVDSRLGAQLDVERGRHWSAVVQVVTEQRMDGSYRPQVEWANIKYQATPDLALRVGRIAMPMFLAADYRKVGYAYAWVRPSVEVYGLNPVTNSDGVDATWRFGVGPVRNVSQASYGHTEIHEHDIGQIDSRGMAAFSNTTEYGAASARVSIVNADLTVDLARPLFQGLAAFGPSGAALASQYVFDHRRASTVSLGLSYDPGSWFAIAEASRIRAGGFVGNTNAIYGTTGYRWGAFTPYAMLARVRSGTPNRVAGLALDGMPPAQAAIAARLNLGLNRLLQTIPMQSSVSLGVRWDFCADWALKVQYDRITPHGGSQGTLTNAQPGFVSGVPVQVASVALDFVL
jgi:hypothetical protein